MKFVYWVNFVVVVDGTHEDFYDVSSIDPFATQSRETLESPVHPECRNSVVYEHANRSVSYNHIIGPRVPINNPL